MDQMTDSPATSRGYMSSNEPRRAVTYRASCDACQDGKVKCSQGKPTCRRCAKKGVRCVYSPWRRIGRPRKAQLASRESTRHDEEQPESCIAGLTPCGSLAEGQHEIVADALSGLSQSHAAANSTAALQNEPDSSSSGRTGTDLGSVATQTPGALSSIHVLPGANGGYPHPAAIPWNGGQENDPGWDDIARNMHPHETGPRITPEAFASGPTEPITPDAGPDCCVAILTRTAKLEQALAVESSAPPIHFILEAERDTRALKNSLFSCRGHVRRGLANDNNNADDAQNCLSSSRPVLHYLSLLIDRIVGLLEASFRLAADAGTAMQDASWSGSEIPPHVGEASRSLLPWPVGGAMRVPPAGREPGAALGGLRSG
ncbi:Uu.00g086490.m01.CDS01 [Anthostomella pinea]|uniref:Uu.00g086490.m01.CDS01 n=1 Tax=Anthostomella pinea TaxID=933095 RepID=A0AAI8VGR9_9PEZI|nr:Uu.00g086490.m01.CDS01 [Anthostomella pinea]